jgi:hypothetical protein
LFYSAARPCRTLRLLSCHRSVDVLRLASPARSFAKLRSDKNRAKRPGEGFRAESLQPLCRFFDRQKWIMFADRPKPERRRLCALFANRAQESDRQVGLGWT